MRMSSLITLYLIARSLTFPKLMHQLQSYHSRTPSIEKRVTRDMIWTSHFQTNMSAEPATTSFLCIFKSLYCAYWHSFLLALRWLGHWRATGDKIVLTTCTVSVAQNFSRFEVHGCHHLYHGAASRRHWALRRSAVVPGPTRNLLNIKCLWMPARSKITCL